jgi:hypothetical protein
VGAERLATPGTIPSTGWSPAETYEQPRGVEPASPPTRSSPRGVGLTFGAYSPWRIALSGFAIPLRPFAGPWGLPPQRRPRPIARPTRLTPGPSPLLQGFHSRSPAAPRPFERSATRLSWGFLPFGTCQTRGSTHAGVPRPATFRPRGFDLLAGLLPASPPGPVSCRSAHGLCPPGVCSSESVGASPEAPSPSRRWLPAGCAPRGGPGRTVSARDPQARPQGFPYPESAPRSRLFARRRWGTIPSWAFFLPGASSASRRAAPIGGSLHELPDGLRTCALQPPRLSEVFTASGLARLREPSSPSEVLSPF